MPGGALASTLRLVLVLSALGAAGALVAVLLSRSGAASPAGSAEPETASGAGSAREPEAPRAPRPRLERVGTAPEELRELAPDEEQARRIEQDELLRQGAARTAGTDPAGARRRVAEPGWAAAEERELRRGLDETVSGVGVRLERIECLTGRCLVELGFDSMQTALGRIERVRRWMAERVPCPAYTEGPEESESPVVRPSQQIWILCGDP